MCAFKIKDTDDPDYKKQAKERTTSNQNSGTLIYTPEINEHFAKILDDIKVVKSSDNLNKEGGALEPEKENDDYSP
ncbi:hypothetical protein C2G38_2209544 [Gigaspora rosea]|uniref:Uncharacterized protein n=1 Tax=Gigaspora rosea TaxID=44941 RepID=A0A397UPY5_9GLOM|nr:hypothetical protein C2G38_2209544 [Gigaspora rosea]